MATELTDYLLKEALFRESVEKKRVKDLMRISQGIIDKYVSPDMAAHAQRELYEFIRRVS